MTFEKIHTKLLQYLLLKTEIRYIKKWLVVPAFEISNKSIKETIFIQFQFWPKRSNPQFLLIVLELENSRRSSRDVELESAVVKLLQKLLSRE